MKHFSLDFGHCNKTKLHLVALTIEAMNNVPHTLMETNQPEKKFCVIILLQYGFYMFCLQSDSPGSNTRHSMNKCHTNIDRTKRIQMVTRLCCRICLCQQHLGALYCNVKLCSQLALQHLEFSKVEDAV